MIEGLSLFAEALVGFAAPAPLFSVLWATLLGITVGMMPGLTATLGVALMTTLTFRMAAGDAILILICMYVGAIYGGSRSAILLNIPGTPANAATTLDGYPLARAGRAGRAMAIATSGSTMGSLIGMLILATVAPILAEFALEFGSFEFFWLAVFGIVVSGHLTALDDPLKGWIAGFLGLLAAMVGQEGIHAYQRFAFGNTDLAGGFGLLPALVGAFGFAEVLTVMTDPAYEVVKGRVESVIPKLGEVFRHWRTIIRSGVIGTCMGIIPGVGEDMGAWASYAAARRASKRPDEFGKGSLEGLISAETGNNAAVPGAIVPVLTLAVPGSAPAAVDRVPQLHLRGGGDDPARHAGHPVSRPGFDAAPAVGAAGAARAADAGDLRLVHHRLVCDRQPDLRHLGDAGLRPCRLCPAADGLSDGAAGAGHRARPATG
jgi:putative tricarboxylic transport membrane protein